MVDYLFAPDDPQAVLEHLASPQTRIVSLTVTEGGYHVHQVTGELDRSDPTRQADLRREGPPSTMLGCVTEALRRRRDAGVPPFAVMSCDNLPRNGEVARSMTTAFARLQDEAAGVDPVAPWIETEVAFPGTMVDRITPVTAPEDVADVAERLGIEDRWPVVCEPFAQWVVEDRCPLGRRWRGWLAGSG